MKLFTRILLLAALFISISSIQSFAKDSLYVYAWPAGTLNNTINGDTTATGESAHIYVLMSDTTYFITEEIRIKDLEIVGKNDQNGYPPRIAPWINEDGSSPGNIAVAINHGYVFFKNLYLLGTRTDGSQVTQQCISTSDSCRIELDHCIVENFGSTGTPNILNTWNALKSDIFVTHCLFRNNQSDVPQNPGMNWAGPGVNAIDTMWVTNSTFFIMGGNIEGSGSSMSYLHFDHNTMFMHTKSSPFSMRQMHNADITNNIFFSVYSAGLDSGHAYDEATYNANFFSPPAVITLDSLYGELEGDPYFLTEADRHINATNNAYFWPQKIMDNYDVMNADLGTYGGVGGRIIAPVWVATRPEAADLLNLSNIQVAEADNFDADPGFDAALVDAAADSMARFVRHVWQNGGSGVGSREFVYKALPANPYDGVPADWKTTKGYPVKEDLRYSNATLMAADPNGKPLGDQTWWPDLVGVKELPNSLPSRFSLSQNYPNPFNPTTNIQYSIPQGGLVTIKVFNLLGQEVATLVNKEQKAGNYVVDFDASKLASGVYMYRLQSGNISLTKKMLLLK